MKMRGRKLRSIVVYTCAIAAFISGCTSPLQTIGTIDIPSGMEHEKYTRQIGRQLANDYSMEWEEWQYEADVDSQFIFGATTNGWLYKLSLAEGHGPEFDISYIRDRIQIRIAGPAGELRAEQIMQNWIDALERENIRFDFHDFQEQGQIK